jgi:hypothetical protein
LQKNFGQSNRVIWTDGDVNGDGTVNRSDLLALVNNFGVGGAIAVGADLDEALKLAGFAPAAVPEPSTAWAALLFAFFVWRACRFRSPRGTC